MLPSAKNYLTRDGLSPSAAAYVTIGCFLGGVVGIQVVSRFMHHYIPSEIVDCDHTHDDQGEDEEEGPLQENGHLNGDLGKTSEPMSEHTPLLAQDNTFLRPIMGERSKSTFSGSFDPFKTQTEAASASRRPSLQMRLSTFVSGAKSSCDSDGPCFGFGDPCGQECLKALNRNPAKAAGAGLDPGQRRHSLHRNTTAPYFRPNADVLPDLHEETPQSPTESKRRKRSEAGVSEASAKAVFRGQAGHRHSSSYRSSTDHEPHDPHSRKASSSRPGPMDHSHGHHHHVPTNAFLSIGLQTSIAIALHKLPEGFITYATNHANPKLGFTVFMALFIHNITEGFAMALPLYLALENRLKAMLWSSLLGGISQPLGAGVAALWFHLAGNSGRAPGETAYGCMFGITSGIMASVALQLFSESLGLTHNRDLCIAFAFIGMAILGISFALTA